MKTQEAKTMFMHMFMQVGAEGLRKERHNFLLLFTFFSKKPWLENNTIETVMFICLPVESGCAGVSSLSFTLSKPLGEKW